MGPLDPKINNGAIGPSKWSYFTRLITTRNPNRAPCFEWSLGLLLEDETTPKIEDMSRFQVVITLRITGWLGPFCMGTVYIFVASDWEAPTFWMVGFLRMVEPARTELDLDYVFTWVESTN